MNPAALTERDTWTALQRERMYEAFGLAGHRTVPLDAIARLGGDPVLGYARVRSEVRVPVRTVPAVTEA